MRKRMFDDDDSSSEQPSESEGESEEVIYASNFCPSLVSEGASQARVEAFH